MFDEFLNDFFGGVGVMGIGRIVVDENVVLQILEIIDDRKRTVNSIIKDLEEEKKSLEFMRKAFEQHA